MDVIILAGGMGTRLKEVVPDVPKSMAPIKGKPFLEYLFNWLSTYSSVQTFVLAVGYKSEIIVDYFVDSFNGIPVVYVNEQEPLGTGGAIFNALKACSSDDVLIINGDTYFPIDIEAFETFHRNNKKPVSIALKKMKDFDRYGTVETLQDSIVKFNEKTYCKEGLINGGIYIVSKNWLEQEKYPSKCSFEKDVLEKNVAKDLLAGKIFDDVFVDIGIPEDYTKATLIV